jgi:hypothetical protein
MPETPNPQELKKNFDALEDLIKMVKKAVETGQDTVDTIEGLSALELRIKAIQNDPKLQNGEAYAQLFIDIAMLIPDHLPIPPALNEMLRAALTLLGNFFGFFVKFAYDMKWAKFMEKLKAGFPAKEAAQATGETMAVQAYLIWRYRQERIKALEAKKTKKVVQRTLRTATFGTATAVLIAIGTQMVTSNDTSGAPSEPTVSVEQPAPVEVAPIEPTIAPHVAVGSDPTPLIETNQQTASVQRPVVDTSVFVGTSTYGAQFQNPAGDCGWGAFDDSILIDLLVGGSAQLHQAQHVLPGGWSVAAEHIQLRLALESATPETYELASFDGGETFTGMNTYQDSSGCVTTYEVTAQRANNVTADTGALLTADVTSNDAAAEAGELIDYPSVTPEAELRTEPSPVGEIGSGQVEADSSDAAAEAGFEERDASQSQTDSSQSEADAEAGVEEPATEETGESTSDASTVETRVGG